MVLINKVKKRWIDVEENERQVGGSDKDNRNEPDGKFCGVTQPDAQTFSILCTEYFTEVTKSVNKKFLPEHVGIITNLETVLNGWLMIYM